MKLECTLQELKDELLRDRDFREKFMKLYEEDDARYVNQFIKRAKEASNKKSDTSTN